MKQIVARAGERTKILHIFSDSIPQQVRFAASPLLSGEPVGGTVEQPFGSDEGTRLAEADEPDGVGVRSYGAGTGSA